MVRFLLVITVVFVTLKILTIIDWDWVWVVSPILIGVVLEIILFVIVFVLGVVNTYLEWKKK